MTRDQRRILRELFAGAKKDILSRAKRFPKDWDGIDLRVYLKEYFEWQASYISCKKRVQRVNDDILVNDLI